MELTITTNKLETFVLENQPKLELIKQSLSEFNIFNVLGVQHREIRHSNFIGWLFDPNESHQLGDIFLKDLFKLLRKKEMIDSGKMVNLLLENLEATQVYRESKNNIDILIVNPDLDILICIENKIHHHITSDQLGKYYQYVEKEYESIGKKLYLTLTPYKDYSHSKFKYGEYYANITYSDIIQLLNNNSEIIENATPFVRESIKQYIRMVEKNVMHNSEEVRLAREIYGKYQKEIDFIISNRLDLSHQSKHIREYFKTENNSGFILSHPLAKDGKFIRVLPMDEELLKVFRYPNFNSWNGDYNFAIEIICERSVIWVKWCFGKIRTKNLPEVENLQIIKSNLFNKMKTFDVFKNDKVEFYNADSKSDYPAICKYILLRDDDVLSSNIGFFNLFKERFQTLTNELINPWKEECLLKLKESENNE